MQPTKAKGDRARPPGDYPVSRADTRDVGAENSSNTTRLEKRSSQTSTSIDPHQSNARIALRQRVGTTSKSHSG
jgi:hypothetical protein